MGITGGFEALGLLKANLEKLAKVPSRIAKPVAEGISDLLERQYAAGKDPYGKAWAPLAASTIRKGRFPPPLTDTWRMRNSTKAVARSGGGVALTVEPHYAGFHQYGTRNMPARQLFPYAGFPRSWRELIERVTAEQCRKVAKGDA